MGLLVLAIACRIVFTILCPVIAGHKNRNVGGWLFGGMFLGLIALIIVCCLPDNG